MSDRHEALAKLLGLQQAPAGETNTNSTPRRRSDLTKKTAPSSGFETREM
jgi:hypothetical protein